MARSALKQSDIPPFLLFAIITDMIELSVRRRLRLEPLRGSRSWWDRNCSDLLHAVGTEAVQMMI
jgi:hypothetical protein